MDSAAWDRRYADRELLWTAHASRFLVEEAVGLAAGRALDLACGEGRNAVWLAERGWEVTGVDFSRVGLEKAQRLAHARDVEVDWVEADLAEYVPPARTFELVLIFYLQVLPAQRMPMVRAAADAVAPAGTLLIVGHDSANLGSGHGGPQDPAVLYSAEDLKNDIDGSGLAIERAEQVRRPVETPEGERVALDALLRARRSG